MATTHHQYGALQGRLGPQGGPLLVPSSVQDIARGSRGWTGAPRSTTCSTLFVLPSRPSVKFRVCKAAAKDVQAAVPPLSMKQCSASPSWQRCLLPAVACTCRGCHMQTGRTPSRLTGHTPTASCRGDTRLHTARPLGGLAQAQHATACQCQPGVHGA